jgi:hypothetical protein
MEALKHTEWVFGVWFIWFAIYGFKFAINPIWIVIILIGSQIPDFLDLFLRKLQLPAKSVRKLTHDYAIVFALWIIFPFNLFPEINLFTTSIAIHYLVDLFSGLEPIYIAGFLFGEYTAILYVTSAHRIMIGKRIEEWGSNYLAIETEEPTPELAWFWVMQLAGTMFCGIGILIYLLRP